MTTEQLIQLQKKIERAKDELAELKGKRKALIEKLEEEFNCSYQDVQKVEDDLKKEVEKLKQQKEKLMHKLDQEFEIS